VFHAEKSCVVATTNNKRNMVKNNHSNNYWITMKMCQTCQTTSWRVTKKPRNHQGVILSQHKLCLLAKADQSIRSWAVHYWLTQASSAL